MSANESFNVIYDRFRAPIFQYVLKRVSRPQRAEEITQEIFLKAYRFQASYDEKHAFSTWLWTIARNTVFDALRSSRGEAAAEAEGEPALDPEELPSPLHCAEELIQKREKRLFLRKMLRNLTRMQRRVLWMRVVQQRSYDEIAKQLGLSLSAVKNLVLRAKSNLVELAEAGALQPSLA